MNRPIKFRAWNGLQMLCEDHFMIRYGTVFAYTEFDGPEKRDWPLMQFTGLKDKNGKEIYEGDVVRWKGFAPDTAKYGVYHSLVCNDDCIAYYEFGSDSDYCASSESESVEVIGNIYENKELLGVGDEY